jgi:dipeptidyl aminopeptidase/acylaminoacyl peptidase
MYKNFCRAALFFITLLPSVYSAEHERNLSPDGRFVASVRPTPGRLIDTALGDMEATELWISRVDGSEARMLVRGVYSDSPKKTIAGISAPRFSPDGRRIYFLSSAWITSRAIHVIDVKSGREHFLCAGNSLEVIPRGKYTGHLIVNRHRYFLGGGSYDWFWLLTPEGKEIDPIASGNEYSLESFRKMYIPSSPGRKK